MAEHHNDLRAQLEAMWRQWYPEEDDFSIRCETNGTINGELTALTMRVELCRATGNPTGSVGCLGAKSLQSMAADLLWRIRQHRIIGEGVRYPYGGRDEEAEHGG